MPAAETTGGRRSTKLLQILFWAGVGLTPLAALLLLIGSGFVLQVAAVLAVLVVLLIGLSIALRRDSDSVRGEVEELLYEEIDTLRDDIRGDITHAARATHGQLAERIGVLHETVDALRNQVDTMRGQMERAVAQPAPPPPHPAGSASVPQGVLRHTETVQVTTKTMVVDPTDQRHDGTVYGARPEIPQQRRPDRSERIPERIPERISERIPGRDWPEQPDRGAEWGGRQERGPERGPEWGPERGPERVSERIAERGPERGQGDWPGRGDRTGPGDWSDRGERTGHGDWNDPADRAERGGRAARSEPADRTGRGGGDPDRADRGGRSDRGDRGDRGEPGPRAERISRSERTERSERSEWTERSERSEWIERTEAPREESWTEQLLRERMARAGGDWPETAPAGEVERSGGGRRRAYDPEDEGNVTGVRTTDRWASVHSDERGGRELRMGERRSAVHADETGTHVRIEDRWATVRHEEVYPDDARDEPRLEGRGEGRIEARADEPRRESPRRSEARRERERDWGAPDHDAERTGRHDASPEFGIERADRTDRAGRGFDAERTGGQHDRDDARPAAHWSESSYEEARRDDAGTTRWSEVRRDRQALGGPQAALPAAPAEPASRWAPGLAGPARDEERVSRRARAAEDDEEYGWNGARDEPRGRAARPIVDFEGSDDRWR